VSDSTNAEVYSDFISCGVASLCRLDGTSFLTRLFFDLAVAVGGSRLFGRLELLTVAFHLALANSLFAGVFGVESAGTLFSSVFPVLGTLGCFSCAYFPACRLRALKYLTFGAILMMTAWNQESQSMASRAPFFFVCQLVALSGMAPQRQLVA
jgi:hypothetical protein